MVSPDPSPSFTRNAADYNKSSPARQLWAQELIAKPGLFGNERVIDIGGGFCRLDPHYMAPWMTRLPEGEKPVFIEVFIDAYLAMYPADSKKGRSTSL